MTIQRPEIPISEKMRTCSGLTWCPPKALRIADFEVGVKRTIVALHVKVPMQLESLNLEVPSGSYEFLKRADSYQIWTIAADQSLQV